MKDFFVSIKQHYDALVEEGNDPVYDTKALKDYMSQWDGEVFLNSFPPCIDKSILEIGIGTGRLAAQVLDLGYKDFAGIDLSKKTIDKARYNLSNYPNVNLIHGDFVSYEFNELYDIIYCSLVFFHFQNKKMVINKIFSILNHGGYFILSISKEKLEILDYGLRKLRLYPDDLDQTILCLKQANFIIQPVKESELAYIIVAKKES